MSSSHPSPDFGAQVRPPLPDGYPATGRLPKEPVESTYTTNHVRLELGEVVVDLVPTPGEEVTARPSDLGLEGPLFVINAGYPSHVPSTIPESLGRVESFHENLRALGWPFHRAVIFPASRAWVELGVALTGLDELDLELLTHQRQLPGVHVWDDAGLSLSPTSSPQAWPRPVPVSIRPVEPGCPMRLDGGRESCAPEGGPWVGASVATRMWWDAHQQLMVSAFGCPVCSARPPAPGRAVPLVACSQPTRTRGWAPGPRLEAGSGPGSARG